MKQIWQYKMVLLLSLISFQLSAQMDSVWHTNPKLNFSGSLDVFYVYDFNQPQGIQRQVFFFNHNRHNEINLNLGLVKFGLEHSKYKANLALHTGTYVDDNYREEAGILKNVSEANIGISLNKTNNLWLDAGIIPSHIGFEGAISMDNMTLTRSILAENSPYFLSGAKLTYNPNDKWEIVGLILNGWQRIQRLDGNSLLSFGTQVVFTPSEGTKLNWSTYIGTDTPDSIRSMRYFNNLYGQLQISEKVGLILGLDFGTQQKTKGSSYYDFWFSPVIIGQYLINEMWRVAIRAEYYKDKEGVIIPTSSENGFLTSGVSVNLDYAPVSNFVCRIEGRWLKSKGTIFETHSNPSSTNLVLGASMAIKFPN